MGNVITLEPPIEYDDVPDFIKANKLITRFEKNEKVKFNDCDWDDIIEKYGSEVDAIEEYIKKYKKGTYYVQWSEFPDNEGIKISKVEL